MMSGEGSHTRILNKTHGSFISPLKNGKGATNLIVGKVKKSVCVQKH